MKQFRALLMPFLDAVFLLIALGRFSLFRRSTSRAEQALIRLFCLTGGRSNDLLSAMVAKTRLPHPISNGTLGVLSPEDIRRYKCILEDDGYLVFPAAIDSQTCDALLKFATSSKLFARPMSDVSSSVRPVPLAEYPRLSPSVVRYDFAAADLLKQPDVQNLMADPGLLAIANAYLGGQPFSDVLAMWWHTSASKVPDEEAAQFWHFDMDRIKWLKVFIYLTDVMPENGPHCFVRGSHKTGRIPKSLLRRGYARLSDEEVASEFGASDLIMHCAPRGTIIIEDTRGLHKGLHVHRDDRLVLQLQFSNSLFGAIESKNRLDDELTPSLAEAVRLHPSVYQRYL